MPWVEKEACIGCRICVNKCPVEGAIKMVGRKAEIDNSVCTRCGICFEVCPVDAIHSNSERSDLKGQLRHSPESSNGAPFETPETSPSVDAPQGRGIGRGNGRGRGGGRGLGGFGRGGGRGKGRNGGPGFGRR